MQVVRKETKKEVFVKNIKAGQVFDYDDCLYLKIYMADVDAYCEDCKTAINLDDEELAVNFRDGGIYTFGPHDTAVIVECEVHEI